MYLQQQGDPLRCSGFRSLNDQGKTKPVKWFSSISRTEDEYLPNTLVEDKVGMPSQRLLMYVHQDTADHDISE